MELLFNSDLANGLSEFNAAVRSNVSLTKQFEREPTKAVTAFLREKGIAIPQPDTFHAHLVGLNNPLPDEPERATIDRYVYIFRKDGMFEFRVIPGSPTGDDDLMYRPRGACCCCNCCAIEI